MECVDSATASREDHAVRGVGDGDAEQVAHQAKTHEVRRRCSGHSERGVVHRGREGDVASPRDELLGRVRCTGSSWWSWGLVLGVFEADRDFRIIVGGRWGNAARIGVSGEAEVFEAVTQETVGLVGLRCRFRVRLAYRVTPQLRRVGGGAAKRAWRTVRLGNSSSTSGGSAGSSGRAMLHLKSEVLEPQSPPFKARTPRAIVADGAGGVGNDALAIALGLEEDHAEAVARPIAVQVEWPSVVWVAEDGYQGTGRARKAAAASGVEAKSGVGAVVGPGVAVPDNVVDDGEIALAIEGGENVVGVGKRLLRDPGVPPRCLAPQALRTITIGAIRQPVLGSVIHSASMSATASRTTWRKAGERRRGDVEVGAASPVFKRAAAIGRWQKGSETAVDLFVCVGVLRRLRRGGCGHDAEGLDVCRRMISILAKGQPAVKCRGVSAALVTSTAPVDTWVGTLRPRGNGRQARQRGATGGRARQSRADPGGGLRREQNVMSHGASGD
ncbi:hypothetical protein ACSSS7_008422 [Eimeria intestinalis]